VLCVHSRDHHQRLAMQLLTAVHRRLVGLHLLDSSACRSGREVCSSLPGSDISKNTDLHRYRDLSTPVFVNLLLASNYPAYQQMLQQQPQDYCCVEGGTIEPRNSRDVKRRFKFVKLGFMSVPYPNSCAVCCTGLYSGDLLIYLQCFKCL